MSGKPTLRVESLSELCSYWDAAFIERAYWTLLGRAPDPGGGSHHLHELRTGLSKLTILLRLRESKEGRERSPKIEGLDEALAKHRQAIQPWTGRLVRWFTGRHGNTRRERSQRAILNHLSALYPSDGQSGVVGQEDQQRSAEVPVSLRTEIGMVDHLLMRMVRVEASLKRIEDRLKAGQPGLSRGKVAKKL